MPIKKFKKEKKKSFPGITTTETNAHLNYKQKKKKEYNFRKWITRVPGNNLYSAVPLFKKINKSAFIRFLKRQKYMIFVSVEHMSLELPSVGP